MNRWLYAGAVVATTALMGSSFAVGKVGLQYAPPILLVGVRFTLAGLLMAAAVWKRPKPSTLGGWMRIGVIGLFQTAGVMGFIFTSLRTIPASESSILTFTNPLLVIVLTTVFFGTRYRERQWFGVGLGLLGVFVTLGLHVHLRSGTILGLLGALSWAVATLLIHRWGSTLDIWTLTAYQMLFGGSLLLAGSLVLEHPWFVLNTASVGIVLWLAVMASIVQFSIWFLLLQRGDPGKTSAFLFLAPFFGVLSGWLILGEPITGVVAVGGALIAASLVLVNLPQH